MKKAGLVIALVLAGCGARSGVLTSEAQSVGSGGSAVGSPESSGVGTSSSSSPSSSSAAVSSSSGGTGGSGACAGTLTLSSWTALDLMATANPGSLAARLVWTGSSLLVVGPGGAAGIGIEPVQISASGITLGPVSMLPAGDVSLSEYASIGAWDGAAVALAWPQMDGSIVMQHVGANGVPLDAMRTVVAATGAGPNTYPSQLLPVAGGYLLAWGAEPQSQAEAQNFVVALTQEGQAVSSPTLLSTGAAGLVGVGGLTTLDDQVYAVWTAWDSSKVGTTTFAALDPKTGAVQTSSVIAKGLWDWAGGLLADPVKHRLAVAVMESNTNLQIYRGSPTALAPLSVMDATSGTFSVALDPCAGLVALTMTPDGMTLMLQPVEDDGSLGVGVTLPTKGQISFFSVVAVHGGLAVGWTDEGSSAQQAHLAFVAVE